MLDMYGRSIEYLRLSITERCTLKCTYCRAGEGLCPKRAELKAADFERIARVLTTMGVSKIRLTGGEPMLRRDLEDIVARLSALGGIREIAMTTNAQHLPGRAAALKQAGLTRLNISLDSLQHDKYRSLTGGGELDNVLNGIAEAMDADLSPLKVNVVLMRGVNDDEVDAFIQMAASNALDVRFIELMPMGEGYDENQRVPTTELLAARPWLKPLPPRHPSQPSADYTADGFKGRVGFISPISHRFCGRCNRVRIMSDGMLRPCLGDNHETSLLEALQLGDDALADVIYTALYSKSSGHTFNEAGFKTEKTMSRIGG